MRFDRIVSDTLFEMSVIRRSSPYTSSREDENIIAAAARA